MSESPRNDAPVAGPSFYAQPKFLNRPRLREWWTVLHPPYTMLHLSLVTIGACLVGPVNAVRLAVTLVAFFLAVGVGAHSLDELHGRPLKSSIPTWQLATASCVGVGGAVVLGIVGMFLVSAYLAAFIVVGVLIAVGYNLELFHGKLHSTVILVLGWGAFPVLTSYFAQHAKLGVSSLFAAAFGALITLIQQQLSSPARDLRRRTASVEGTIVRSDGTTVAISEQTMLQPLERALRTLCWAGVAMALALAYLQFRH
jgi:positive regulator of sigma E activity